FPGLVAAALVAPEDGASAAEAAGCWDVVVPAVPAGLAALPGLVARALARRRDSASRSVASAGLLESFLDALPLPVFFKDVEGRYRVCNRAFAGTILGLPKEAVAGRTIGELSEAIPPDLGAVYRDADRRLLASGDTQVYEAPVRCADGEEREFFFRKVLHRDEAGIPRGIVGVMLDITERKRAESSARAAEARLRAVFEAVPDGIFLKDADGRYTMANAACHRIYGRAPGSLVGRTAEDAFGLEVAGHVRQADARVLAGERIETELEMTVEGEVRTMRVVKVPLDPVSGAGAGVCGVARDITLERRAGERLVGAERMQAVGQLAGGVAHDFNNQLVAILGYADILREEFDGHPEWRRHVELVLRAARRSAELVRQLLAFARRGRYQHRAVDMHELLEEALALLVPGFHPSVRISKTLGAASPVCTSSL
ncbi:MAG: hypothetical protein CVV20_01435, partial [Gemmatimonadetes bacterium HGW-Gemmatimonadetes-1]